MIIISAIKQELIIFCPETDEMYNKNNFTTVIVSEISEKLEGHFRPGHFSGVATIVAKLLNAVKPVNMYLGRRMPSRMS